MSFLFLPGLLALLSLPIVIWLHLRRQKLKRVVVPSLLMWKNLPTPKRRERRRWLPITLLLLLHLLIAALISFALGNPHTTQWLTHSDQHLAIIVDVSNSMDARDTAKGKRLDTAREKVQEKIDALSGDDRISLISAGAESHLLATGDLSNRMTLMGALDALSTSDNTTDIDDALTLAITLFDVEQKSGTAKTTEQRIMIVSDLEQPSQMPAYEQPIEWVRVGTNPSNRAIVALAVRPRSNKKIAGYSLYARFANYGSDGLTTPFRIFGDDRLLDTHLVKLLPDGEVEYTWDLPANIKTVRAELDGKDSMPADDVARIGINENRNVNTLLISEEPESLERVLKALPNMNLVTLRPEIYATSPLVSQADLTIFDQTMPQSASFPPGSLLFISPPVGSSTLFDFQTADPVSGTLSISDEGKELFDDLNIGSIQWTATNSIIPPSWAHTLLAIEDVPLILRGKTDQSNVVIWNFDVRTITTRLIFPMLVARTVQDLIPEPLPDAISPGESFVVHLKARTNQVVITDPNGQEEKLEIAPDQSALRIDMLKTPGLYTLSEQHNNTVVSEHFVAVNIGSPQESNLRPRPAQNITKKRIVPVSPDANDAIANAMQEEQHPIWSWLLLATMGLLMIEWVYYTGTRSPVRKQRTKM